MIRQFPPEDQKSAQTSVAARREFLAKVLFLQTIFQMQQFYFCVRKATVKSLKYRRRISTKAKMMIGNRVARAIADASETGWVLLSDQLPFSLSDVAVNKYRAKHGG